MTKHSIISTPDMATQSGFAPRHRASFHKNARGAAQLNVDTVVAVVNQFGDDWGTAQILSFCECGCGQYAIAPVGWYESETTTVLDSMAAQNMEARVIDAGQSTPEGVPVVHMVGVYRMR
jgi:hypothetical protein